MGLILKNLQWRINSYLKNSPVSLRVPWLVFAIVTTMDGGLTMCFSDRMLSILLKYFHCFFAVPFPLFLLLSFSTLYFCLSFCFSLLFHFVYDFFDSELMTLGLKLYLIHEKISNI